MELFIHEQLLLVTDDVTDNKAARVEGLKYFARFVGKKSTRSNRLHIAHRNQSLLIKYKQIFILGPEVFYKICG